MAGTLTISTLSDGTNSTSSTNCIQGSAKAWVNFNGITTATIRASYNVSSITYNAAGDYTLNFTTALADANYAPVCMTSSDATRELNIFSSASDSTAPVLMTTTQ